MYMDWSEARLLPNANTVGSNAFDSCCCLRKVALPSARSIGEDAFRACYDLRHITLHPDVEVDKYAFLRCLSLEVLAASTNFEIDTGDKDEDGDNDPTRGITRYLKWINQNDLHKDNLYDMLALLKLCNKDEDDDTPARASTSDPIMKFLVEKGCGKVGFAAHFLKFLPQFHFEKRGMGDLRGKSKDELLKVALELKMLRERDNEEANAEHWGVRVDSNGEFVCKVNSEGEPIS